MKIVEVIADSSLSGAPKHLLTLISGINKKNFSITLICPKGWLSKKAKQLKIETINIKMAGFSDFSSVSKIKKEILKIKPDIVHLHGIRAGWLGAMALGGQNKKIIYTEHLYNQNYHLQSRLRQILQINGLSYILKKTEIIITPSLAVKNFLCQKFKIPKNKVIIVANGLKDIKISKHIEKEKIGFIGSLNHQKGVEYLIKSFKTVIKKFPNIKLEIIGDGPLRKILEKKANKISKNIIFLGAKNNIWKYLSNWKMLIIPSRSEAFGQTAVEAAILHKPVVASDIVGLNEVIRNNITGLLFKEGNTQSLAKKIIYLLKNPKIAKKMGKKGRKRFEKLYNSEIMVNKIERIYFQHAKQYCK